MPVSKDALKRYRVIDKLLSDPNRDYTTNQILDYVNRSTDNRVGKRMIQKDLLALEEEFGKTLLRNSGRRGSVRYEDQSTPLFYQELTRDEEELLREVLRTLGQFEGLSNFTWFDLLSKKLSVKNERRPFPIISFGEDDILQFSCNLLGRLFTAISREKTISIKYKPFGKSEKEYEIYPYQLRQFNYRWFLIATPVGNEVEPYREDFVANFALDRMNPDFEYLEDVPYVRTSVDLKSRFHEIVGVTLYADKDVECIYYAVSPKSVDYIRSKMIHRTQMEATGEELQRLRKKFPQFKEWNFFSIECRPNHELFALLESYGGNIVVLEPYPIRAEIVERVRLTAANYGIADMSGDESTDKDKR